MPRMCVIMPCRNADRWLETSLASTLRALPEDAYLLAVDDGSTDRTGELLGRFAERDARVKVVEGPHKSGVAGSLNLALEHVDAEYVARMDADDVCTRRRFVHELDYIKRHCLDLCFGQVLFVGAGGKPRLRQPLAFAQGVKSVPLHLLVGNVLVHPTLLARTEAIAKLRGYKNVGAEDYDMWLRAAEGGLRVGISPHFVLRYRVHEAQATRSIRNSFAGEIIESYRRLAKYHGWSPTDGMIRSVLTRSPHLDEEWRGLDAVVRRARPTLGVVERSSLSLRWIALQRVLRGGREKASVRTASYSRDEDD